MDRKFIDNKGYVYYVSPLLGERQYSICKKLNSSNSIGVHRWKCKENKICETKEQAEKMLIEQAIKRGWEKVKDEDDDIPDPPYDALVAFMDIKRRYEEKQRRQKRTGGNRTK